jgi:uncharacterized protein (DUF362 family)
MHDDRSKVVSFIVKALDDDYESIETLVNYQTEPQPDMPSFTRDEVVQALAELIASGRVQPYLYSELDQKLMPSEFLSASAESCWFGLTNEGKRLLSQLTE